LLIFPHLLTSFLERFQGGWWPDRRRRRAPRRLRLIAGHGHDLLFAVVGDRG